MANHAVVEFRREARRSGITVANHLSRSIGADPACAARIFACIRASNADSLVDFKGLPSDLHLVRHWLTHWNRLLDLIDDQTMLAIRFALQSGTLKTELPRMVEKMCTEFSEEGRFSLNRSFSYYVCMSLIASFLFSFPSGIHHCRPM